MENNIDIVFIKENKTISLEIQQPDLTNLIHRIVAEHLEVSKNNITIETNNTNFDKDEFKNLLLEVHEEFCEEIDKFYENISKEIQTYYKDEDLSKYIIDKIKNIYSEEAKNQ